MRYLARKIGILMISLEKLGNRWGKLKKLDLEILEMSAYRTLENKAGSSPVSRIMSAMMLHLIGKRRGVT
jgi:hypothetical protein